MIVIQQGYETTNSQENNIFTSSTDKAIKSSTESVQSNIINSTANNVKDNQIISQNTALQPSNGMTPISGKTNIIESHNSKIDYVGTKTSVGVKTFDFISFIC